MFTYTAADTTPAADDCAVKVGRLGRRCGSWLPVLTHQLPLPTGGGDQSALLLLLPPTITLPPPPARASQATHTRTHQGSQCRSVTSLGSTTMPTSATLNSRYLSRRCVRRPASEGVKASRKTLWGRVCVYSGWAAGEAVVCQLRESNCGIARQLNSCCLPGTTPQQHTPNNNSPL